QVIADAPEFPRNLRSAIINVFGVMCVLAFLVTLVVLDVDGSRARAMKKYEDAQRLEDTVAYTSKRVTALEKELSVLKKEQNAITFAERWKRFEEKTGLTPHSYPSSDAFYLAVMNEEIEQIKV